jgi:hypothetical protein
LVHENPKGIRIDLKESFVAQQKKAPNFRRGQFFVCELVGSKTCQQSLTEVWHRGVGRTRTIFIQLYGSFSSLAYNVLWYRL